MTDWHPRSARRGNARKCAQVAVDIITWVLGIAAYLSVLVRTIKQGIAAGSSVASLLPQCARCVHPGLAHHNLHKHRVLPFA